MKTTIIGSGNVATVLGRKIKAAGHDVLQVFSRNIHHAHFLGSELQCGVTDNIKSITNEADIYLLAVNDAAIPEIAAMLGFKKGLVLHSAGSVPGSILKTCSANYGVLYPLQSLRKHKAIYLDIPLLVDGNTADALCLTTDFAGSISGRVKVTDDITRLKMHLAAVVVNNFTNHLYSLAADYCDKEQLDFCLLKPLIEETAMRLEHHDPRQLQTGPAVRKDLETIEKHLELLANNAPLLKIYEMMTESIKP